MRSVIFLDTETTGLDPATSRCIEVAVVAYDLEHRAPIECYSSLIRSETNEAERVNRIPVEMLSDAPPANNVWARVEGIIDRHGTAIIAHRAAFDRSFVPEESTFGRPWICSKYDIEWPMGKLGDPLAFLALAHGVPVFTAHRAMADVETMVRLFQRVAEMGHDVPAMLARAMRPKVKVVAQVSFDDREKAKSAGFAWDGTRKRWWRDMPSEDIAALPFRTCVVAS